MDDPSSTAGVTVNGRSVTFPGQESTPLLYLLRNDLGLKGVRPGCAVGDCGACTVIVDGAATRSCITPFEVVAGATVVTPEGLGTPEQPHPIQQTFIDEQAAQCGYCINGIIMTVAAIAEAPAEDRADALDAALAEHICRCGTHVRILRAARRALLGDAAMPPAEPEVHSEQCTPACEQTKRPEVLDESPNIEHWIRVLEDGTVEATSGKVELGQGIRTALAQLVVAQLAMDPREVVVRDASAPAAPDEKYTSGSMSIEAGGMALACAATALRRVLVQRAAAQLSVPPSDLRVADGAVHTADGGSLLFAELVVEGPVTGPIEMTDRPHWHGAALGVSVPRADLVPKLTGSAAYVHDLDLPGMLHARAVLPPTYEARLQSADVAAAEAMPGVRTVVQDGSLLIVVAEREEQARAAAARLQQSAQWDRPGLAVGRSVEEMLRGLETTPIESRVDEGVGDAFATARQRLSASYVRPYNAHGAMAPSCAVAEFTDGVLTVHSHTQGVFPLRKELATVFGMDVLDIVVNHVDGPGCYGHNCADDAAEFAAVAARAVAPAPVRFQMSSEDELAWDPLGSAMLSDLEAGLDDGGRIVAWRHRSRTDVHTTRPIGAGNRLIASWLMGEGQPRPWTGPHDTGIRNMVPIYDIPAVDAVTDYIRGPLRTSALRSLGSHQNIFAGESFMDELAEAAQLDPVEFRLKHLSDPRSRDVLEAAASAAGWQPHVGPSGRGQGVAVARYKNTKAYVGCVVDASMDPERGTITVSRVVLACDAGVIVNPDGLRNQLEGGIVQGLSRALIEEVRFDASGVHARDWTSYPVIRFADIPPIEIILIDRAGAPPVGSGEASTPVVAPALANALDDAIGIRLRRLPFTAEQAQQRLAEMSDAEMARVLV